MNLHPLYQVFVYGSLREGFRHPAYEYIKRYFELVSPATVMGLLYDMGEYPAAVATDSDARIVGELYRIREVDEFEWAMAQLDDYEGVAPEDGEPQLYRREKTTVILPNGSTTEAWIYWYSGDVSGRPRVTSGDVLEYLRAKGGL
ncbi:gamma-glutamylcyclotransferase family protein [Flavihumibacter sp.]|uniref:gamma-glutamylcyclotransferase family protein n=1 Tax=Flavihumibacter sp. TaxID=1913981 RepID=UPI002FCBCCEA|nr:gamma-glutamylcyclotransferase [Flavihumibacter sediminis]